VALPTLIDAVAALPAFARVVNTVPVPGARLTIGGTAGSSDAVVLAALARRLPTRFFVVVTEGVPQAERWLADLQAILTGCVVAAPQPTEGRRYANGWASIDLAGGATIFLQPTAGGTWTLRAARRAGWQIEYPAWSGGFPQTVRLQATQPALMVDLTVGLSQIETNKDLEDAAFNVNVPRDAEAITLDELRESGPLGAR